MQFKALTDSAPLMMSTPDSMKLLIERIKAFPTKTIVSISGQYVSSDDIIKADKIVFDDGAELIFAEPKGDVLAVVAKEIVFASPNHKARIFRNPNAVGQTGVTGATGGVKPPTPPNAPNKHGGTPGTNGADGGPGGVGETYHLPPFLMAANRVSRQGGGATEYVDLRIQLDGLDGGKGGTGGSGAPGGDGGGGGKGVDYLVGCAGGPGNGGAGGNGGRGGPGGPGGDGGNGADVYFAGPSVALAELELSRVIARGGLPGEGGDPGVSGPPGSGGPRGGRTAYCTGGSDGPGGSTPAPHAKGAAGQREGQRGKVASVQIPDVSIFF